MGSRDTLDSTFFPRILIDENGQPYIPLDDDIEGYFSRGYVPEGIDPYQSSTPYFVDSLCQSPTLETCFKNLHLFQQVDHPSVSNLPAPVSPDIMHGLPASVPTSAPDQQGRPTSQSPRAVPVPEKILPIARNITSYPDIRISDPDHVSKRIMHSCKWRRDDGSLCRGNISWTTCSDHLAVHGIEDMPSMLKITCGWCDKKVKRESIVRHVREKHLGVKRVVKHLGVKHAVKPPPREDRAPSPGRT